MSSTALTNPFISIIIPCRNEEKYISNCLESILLNDYPLKRLEILIIDGESNDSTRAIIKDYSNRYPNIKLLLNPDKLTPISLNIGVRNSIGDIIMRMDVHSTYDKNYISTLAHSLKVLNCDNVGGVWEITPSRPGIIAHAITLATSSPFGIGDAWYRIGSSKIREVDTVPYGCYRREVFDRIGLFDEDLHKNQDDEFNSRLKKHGGKIFLIPEAKIKYYARETISQIAGMFYLYGFYKPLVNIKVGKPSTIRQLVPPSFVLAILSLSIFAIFNKLFLSLLLLLLSVYILTDLIYSLNISQKHNKLKLSPILCILFPTIHLSYGTGYVLGLIYHPFNRLFRKAR